MPQRKKKDRPKRWDEIHGVQRTKEEWDEYYDRLFAQLEEIEKREGSLKDVDLWDYKPEEEEKETTTPQPSQLDERIISLLDDVLIYLKDINRKLSLIIESMEGRPRRRRPKR